MSHRPTIPEQTERRPSRPVRRSARARVVADYAFLVSGVVLIAVVWLPVLLDGKPLDGPEFECVSRFVPLGRAIEEWPELDRDLSPLLPRRRVVFRALVERGYRCAPVRRAIYERLRVDRSSR